MLQKLKEIRKKSGLTQEQLAELIGSSRTQITKWENGDQPMTIYWLEKVAKALNVTPAYILNTQFAN